MSGVRDLAELLNLNSAGQKGAEVLFEGSSAHVPDNRIYGGQLLGQATIALGRSVGDNRAVNSLHGYFVRAGDSAAPVVYGVESLRDGRSFATRRVQAYQQGHPIFSAVGSLQVPSSGPKHQAPMPEGLPNPDELTTRVPYAADAPPGTVGAEELIEIREVPGEFFADREVVAHAAWARVRCDLPDDQLLRRAALAYLSDAIIQDPILAAHGLDWWAPEAAMASLDHAIWWYADRPLDGWLLAFQESPVADGARGLGVGRLHAADGTLLAATAQEMMIRFSDDRLAAT